MGSGSADQPVREPATHQRYGPLSLLRVHKDDGRSLVLYERIDAAAVRPPADAGEPRGGPAGTGEVDGGGGAGQV